MNRTFPSVLSTGLSAATDLAQTFVRERIVTVSGGFIRRRPATPAGTSFHCWESLFTCSDLLACNDGGASTLGADEPNTAARRRMAAFAFRASTLLPRHGPSDTCNRSGLAKGQAGR